jgi:organic radical activating enzyme
MDSIYWVLSRDCNQRCPHCYNNSEPGAAGLTLEDVSRCVSSLPDPSQVSVGRLILSGGEVLVWPDLLFHAIQCLNDKYGDATQIWVQTNGDLLDRTMLQRLLDHRVRRIDVASMDKYHVKGTLQRAPVLEAMFRASGMVLADRDNDQCASGLKNDQPRYSFWGATEDEWIGPLWPRGRAFQKGLSKAGPEDRFCSLWSGAKHFLDYHDPGSEVNIQLADVYPCCPMTCHPLGNLLEEPLIAMLDRCQDHPAFRALNAGRPEAMGESLGITEDEGFRRSLALGNHCLWCDEFFTKHATDLLHRGGRTARGSVDLIQLNAQ